MGTSLQLAQLSVLRRVPVLWDYTAMGKQRSEITRLLKALLPHLRSLPLPLSPICELEGTSPARGDLCSKTHPVIGDC